MPTANRKVRALIVTNLLAAACFALLLIQDTRQWPILIAISPIVVIANVSILKGRPAIRIRPSIFLLLSACYGFGFVFILLMMIFDFDWWEFALLPIPVGLMALSIWFYRTH